MKNFTVQQLEDNAEAVHYHIGQFNYKIYVDNLSMHGSKDLIYIEDFLNNDIISIRGGFLCTDDAINHINHQLQNLVFDLQKNLNKRIQVNHLIIKHDEIVKHNGPNCAIDYDGGSIDRYLDNVPFNKDRFTRVATDGTNSAVYLINSKLLKERVKTYFKENPKQLKIITDWDCATKETQKLKPEIEEQLNEYYGSGLLDFFYEIVEGILPDYFDYTFYVNSIDIILWIIGDTKKYKKQLLKSKKDIILHKEDKSNELSK